MKWVEVQASDWNSIKNFFFRFAILIFVALASSVTCDKDPLECQILVDRGRGLTFCQFYDINGTEQDTSRVNVKSTMFQGQLIESNRVSAIAIASSEFDEIPSSIFTNFGDIFRFKFFQGRVKTIKKESFVHATSLRAFEMIESQIEEISPNAFEGAVNLEEISFENCKIGKIAENAFAGLPKLKSLHLNGTKYPNSDFLKKLPSKVSG